MQWGQGNHEDREVSQHAAPTSLDGTDLLSDQVDLLCEITTGGPYGRLSFALCPADTQGHKDTCSP